MLKRHWIFVAALIGLAFVTGLGQAQEQEALPNQDTEQTQQSTDDPDIPLSVRIIEDQEQKKARESIEQEARDNQNADLFAQQGMDTATQRMADYAHWQTWLVGIGTLLLIVTLVLTFMANMAAQKAVRVTRQIGEAQTRAYLAFSDLTIDVGTSWDSKFTRMINYSFKIDNLGNTPALNIKWTAVIEEFVLSEVDQQRTFFPALKERVKGKKLTRIDVGNLPAKGLLESGEKQIANYRIENLTDDQNARIEDVVVVFAIALRVVYQDVFAPDSPEREVIAFASCRQHPDGSTLYHRLEKYDEQS